MGREGGGSTWLQIPSGEGHDPVEGPAGDTNLEVKPQGKCKDLSYGHCPRGYPLATGTCNGDNGLIRISLVFLCLSFKNILLNPPAWEQGKMGRTCIAAGQC